MDHSKEMNIGTNSIINILFKKEPQIIEALFFVVKGLYFRSISEMSRQLDATFQYEKQSKKYYILNAETTIKDYNWINVLFCSELRFSKSNGI